MNGKLVMPLLTLLGVGSQYALAQNYPARTIRLVVPSSPGGGSDFGNREVGKVIREAGIKPQ